MNGVGKPEKVTQARVVKLFKEELGYDYLGNWIDREENSNIEEKLLTKYLEKSGYNQSQINIALDKLKRAANNPGKSLYENNKAVYELLRYGVAAKTEAGKVTETVQLINWNEPEKNDFAIAEEVTLRGNFERRPDLVLYINGIAFGVIELKNSRVSIGDGIRQLISNQSDDFNSQFFSTAQFLFAGNDTEGLKYGTIGTPEKFYLTWKEDEEDNTRYKIDKYLLKICTKDRIIELMRDFVLFDAGIKKLPRVHQYFGVKAAQEHVRKKESGIIWHTQGSGKSIVMVLLAQWILENNPNARVAIITDRDELDKQIEGVFSGVGEKIHRTTSGRDLMQQLGKAAPRLLCSLVHKFGRHEGDDFDAFIEELEAKPTQTVGDVFLFVDECHRTQSGKLHRAMKAIVKDATFIGFTGTPLLKKDKATTLKVFERWIHTYKFSEAVEDGVVLDLVYESRDIDQVLRAEDKVDTWFDAKTRGLNDWQKDELKRHWATMQKVLSSKARMDRIVSDIIFDFGTKPRLISERGNAILVASSIYEACKYYTLFQKTPFKGRCGLVTSYNPQARDISKEDTGANSETDKQFVYNAYTELLEDVKPDPNKTKTETYEDRVKELFVKEPSNMKLLIVVNKLLTGFDAPPCTYLYIEKSMQDHDLFQAICRTNRLDGEDKPFGYIVDYKDLFTKVEHAISVYSSELDHESEGASPEVLMKDRREEGKRKLDTALEALEVLCEPVPPPRGELEYIHYFCGNTEIASDLEEREPQRVALYKGIATFVRSYANIADELEAVGYSKHQIAGLKEKLEYYVRLRDVIRHASGEVLDLKPYEADMRHLIDTYIEAEEPRKISPFDDISLVDLIVKSGIADAINAMPKSMRNNQDAVAEAVENNIRKKIIKEHLTDPAFYDKMSALLDEVLAARKSKAIEYEEYLKQIADLAKKVQAGRGDDTPEALDTPGKRAIYNNLQDSSSVDGSGIAEASPGYGESGALDLALSIDEAVKRARPDKWRGVQAKERVIKGALYEVLQDKDEVERLFSIIKQNPEY